MMAGLTPEGITQSLYKRFSVGAIRAKRPLNPYDSLSASWIMPPYS